jgi:16S rRNA (adenine1518-N6/adenine1519-N6)-dimethyltransferase
VKKDKGREMIKSKTEEQRPKTEFAKKSFGQNFLVDENYISKIITALNPQQDETIIEIGAGRGALTQHLIESGANVIAIELEREMIAVLLRQFARKDNFRLVGADALKIDFNNLVTTEARNTKSKLVANLPYYISTAILQKLIEQREVFSEMILMFQLEVTERITANVGNSKRGFLTVLTEAYLESEKLFDVPPNAFRPVPKVWSAVVRLKPRAAIENENEKSFRQIVSAGFRQKRKTIENNLKSEFANIEKVFDECRIERQRRAETLTVEEWNCLAKQKASSEL